MQNILYSFFRPLYSPVGFQSTSQKNQYEDWDMYSRQIHISTITCLTAFLYIVFSFLDKSFFASEEVQSLMHKLHLIIMAPMMVAISFFAYKKRFYKLVMIALAISPIVGGLCHVYIASKLDSYAPFLAESYLTMPWIFIVSGMSYRYALISALSYAFIMIISAFYLMNQIDMFVIHVFWLFCGFSFGLIGGFLLEGSKKALFSNQQKLHHLAITDSLTGLFNRNQLNNILPQEIERSLRYDRTFGFLMVDIDFFKNINDKWGHDVGDKTLQKVAKTLSKLVRKNDTLIRWGGEEFVVVALEVDEPSLIRLCNNLREKIENEDYGVVGKITVSIGATMFNQNDSLEKLLTRADQALYKAKDDGRNITVYK